MFGTFGLQTYIWNNRLKSVLLLLGFPVLLLLISYGVALFAVALNNPSVGAGFYDAANLLPSLLPFAIGASLIWFLIAYVANQWIVDMVTGAREVTRKEEPRLWNLLENLCISRGLSVPSLRIIQTPALNAFASGIHEGRYSITLTSGLLATLDDAELEAVLGHELTHIRNRDVQLLVICAVFVGIISLAGDLLVRSPRFFFYSGGSSRRRSDNKNGGGGLILILVAIGIFLLARFLGLALRMAVSRQREFLADAGSVELTKNPDAMIAALRKIEGHSEIAAPAQIREMFLDHRREAGLAGLFATHPSIEARVAALVENAGGHDSGPLMLGPAEAEGPPPEPASRLGPWGGIARRGKGPWG